MVSHHTYLQISVNHNADFVRYFDSVGELVGVHQVACEACDRDVGEYAARVAAYGFGLLFAHRI